jgi:hypothetical protein
MTRSITGIAGVASTFPVGVTMISENNAMAKAMPARSPGDVFVRAMPTFSSATSQGITTAF